MRDKYGYNLAYRTTKKPMITAAASNQLMIQPNPLTYMNEHTNRATTSVC
jgi:hypothetical protein